MERIENVRIVLKNKVITGTIVMDRGKIYKIIEHSCDFNGTVIPGFIDIRTKGGFGFDFMDGRLNGGYERYCENILTTGTTSVVQATHASSNPDLKKSFQDYVRFKNLPSKTRRAHHLGINLAGKWINKELPGDNDIEHIEEGELTKAIEWMELSQNHIIMSELAMEIEGNRFVGRWLSEKGVAVTMANTKISMQEALDLQSKKISSCATNLFSNMSSYNPLNPGLVPAALDNRHIKAVMPVDERRINQKLLVSTIKKCGSKKIILSSFSTKEMEYKLIDGFRKLAFETDLTLYELVRMFSTNPARLLNYGSQKGEIAEGMDADLIILDNQLRINKVIVNGQ